MDVVEFDQLFIGGGWRDGRGESPIEVEDPTTQRIIGRVASARAADLDDAVAAARAGQLEWAKLSDSRRADHLERLLNVLTEKQDELGRVISMEVGTPAKISKIVQVGLPISVLAATIAQLRDPDEEERLGNSRIVREPVGVIGCITPWNYPLHQTLAKLGGALAAGNTVVHKPAGLAPLNSFMLAEAIHEAGLPDGVYNLVPGSGAEIGDALAGHPGIDMVSFTGSTSVGAAVAARAAATVKRVSLELGGKSANVILDDADLARVVKAGVSNCFLNSGQTCSAWTRMIVPRERLAEVEGLAKAAAEKLVPGSPFDESARLGPLISEQQRDQVRGHIDRAIQDGAKLITGGSQQPDGLDTGYFVKPTVFSEVSSDSRLSQEEVFGPVLAIIAHDGDEDAIRIANDSPYGLSGGVSSGDEERAMRVARRMRTGQVDVNGAAFNPLAPFGGYGQSGYGRELGPYGVEEFTNVKAIQT
ncbi:MAG TPA: aldehyde dehydrogenase family protein [Solirubrobacterales bacterium]|nr:aldehyde dehydrogenase family protein [Solirubrobacterales bacterium]